MDSATSSQVPNRPRGIERRNSSWSLAGNFAVISVSMKPGATAFTVIPREATSRATALVNPRMPALVAAYIDCPALPVWPTTDDK